MNHEVSRNIRFYATLKASHDHEVVTIPLFYISLGDFASEKEGCPDVTNFNFPLAPRYIQTDYALKR